MLKLVRGPVPAHMTCQVKETAHLPLSEQFKTIENQAKLEAVTEINNTKSKQWL